MAQNKTQMTTAQVAPYLQTVEPARRRADAIELDTLFRHVTGFAPRMWGAAIVGYGRYRYTYASGRSGEFLATGFAPRKAALSVYIMPGYADFAPILSRLGKHKTGRSCLYINKLADVDLDVLGELIRAGLRDLATHWPVEPT